MLNTLENHIKMSKFKGYNRKANAISFWAIIFSIIFYISIFCYFNIHPYTIINTTKFWFFISNTLILIIAADFGVFSSSREHDDLYEEYVKISTQPRTSSSFEAHYMRIVEKKLQEKDHIIEKTDEEKIKDVVVDEKFEAEAAKMAIVIKDDIEKHGESLHDEKKENPPRVDEEDHEEKKKNAICLRSNSDKAIMVENEERKIILQRSKSEKHEVVEVEESEFSSMSIEELNRRVEEFIQKFNRQIRLQAARNRQNRGVSCVFGK